MTDSPESSTPTNNQDVPPDNGERAADAEKQDSRAQLAEISRLLRGEPEPPADTAQDTQPPEPGKPSRAKAPRSLDELSKALGIEAAALYDIEIPLRAGQSEKVKLGALKDYYAQDSDHQLSRVQWEERRSQQEAELERSRAELAELFKAVPQDKLNKEVLNAARQRVDAIVSAERRRTLERIPEWNDDDKRTADLTAIAEHLADFGLPANTLQGIHDHRILAYMRDNMLRKRRLEQALAKVQPVRRQGVPKSGPAKKAPSSPVSNSGGARTIDNQVDAVSRLLRG